MGIRSAPHCEIRVARALLSKGVTLGALNRHEEAIAAYDELVKRFGEAEEPVLRERVAKALINKGFNLRALNRTEEAITAYDEVVKRFGESDDQALRERVARALVDKGLRLSELNRSAESMSAYAEVMKRFEGATEPSLRKTVGTALNELGFQLIVEGKACRLASNESGASEHFRKSSRASRAAIEREPEDAIILGIKNLFGTSITQLIYLPSPPNTYTPLDQVPFIKGRKIGA